MSMFPPALLQAKFVKVAVGKIGKDSIRKVPYPTPAHGAVCSSYMAPGACASMCSVLTQPCSSFPPPPPPSSLPCPARLSARHHQQALQAGNPLEVIAMFQQDNGLRPECNCAPLLPLIDLFGVGRPTVSRDIPQSP